MRDALAGLRARLSRSPKGPGWADEGGKPRLDVFLAFDRYLLGGDEMEVLFDDLRRSSPSWSERLTLRPTPQERVEIPDGVRSVTGYVQMAVTMRGPTYGRVADARKDAGYPVVERVHGGTEVRGRRNDLIVVINVDAQPHFTFADGVLRPNNRIALQIIGDRVERRPATDWALEAMVDLCRDLRPMWAVAHDFFEWDRRVISHEGGGLKAIGVDFRRFLPGLFAWNYFGARYADVIGRERLLGAPASDARELGEGILVRILDDPFDWDSPDGRRRHDDALAAIGPEFFFSMDDPARLTRSPLGHTSTPA